MNIEIRTQPNLFAAFLFVPLLLCMSLMGYSRYLTAAERSVNFDFEFYFKSHNKIGYSKILPAYEDFVRNDYKENNIASRVTTVNFYGNPIYKISVFNKDGYLVSDEFYKKDSSLITKVTYKYSNNNRTITIKRTNGDMNHLFRNTIVEEGMTLTLYYNELYKIVSAEQSGYYKRDDRISRDTLVVDRFDCTYNDHDNLTATTRQYRLYNKRHHLLYRYDNLEESYRYFYGAFTTRRPLSVFYSMWYNATDCIEHVQANLEETQENIDTVADLYRSLAVLRDTCALQMMYDPRTRASYTYLCNDSITLSFSLLVSGFPLLADSITSYEMKSADFDKLNISEHVIEHHTDLCKHTGNSVVFRYIVNGDNNIRTNCSGSSGHSAYTALTFKRNSNQASSKSFFYDTFSNHQSVNEGGGISYNGLISSYCSHGGDNCINYKYTFF